MIHPLSGWEILLLVLGFLIWLAIAFIRDAIDQVKMRHHLRKSEKMSDDEAEKYLRAQGYLR
jgi:hypothetical protein